MGSLLFLFLLFPIILKSLANALPKEVQNLLEGRGGPGQRTNPGMVFVALCHLGVITLPPATKSCHTQAELQDLKSPLLQSQIVPLEKGTRAEGENITNSFCPKPLEINQNRLTQSDRNLFTDLSRPFELI